MLNHTITQDNNLISKRHRFYLIMRHVNHGCIQTIVQTSKLDTHLHTQRGIKIRQRFIKEKNLRLAYHSATNGNTLALTTRELAWLTIQKFIELERLRHLFDLAITL
ncbi:hypothetical protein D9M69_585650 [compost metagenome]